MSYYVASFFLFILGWLMALFSQNYEAMCIGLSTIGLAFLYIDFHITQLENAIVRFRRETSKLSKLMEKLNNV